MKIRYDVKPPDWKVIQDAKEEFRKDGMLDYIKIYLMRYPLEDIYLGEVSLKGNNIKYEKVGRW